MFKKIRLFHEVREFYKTFNPDEKPFITKVSDITNDNLYDVLFDIEEVLDASFYGYYEETEEINTWLTALKEQIYDFREPKRKHPIAIALLVIALLAVALIGGYLVGRNQTIHQAELIKCTSTEYHIGFGKEIHAYTFED